MKRSLFIPGIIWFIISTILLCLPGNDLPKSRFFDIPYFDKMVHLIMFFLITILFCYPFKVVGGDNRVSKSWCVAIAFFTVIYGIVIEFVQKFFVSGRSFDATDILFDGLGSSVAVIVVSAFFVKK